MSKEALRLRTLVETGLLDSASHEALDRFTRLASELLRTPVSLISLVDSERQYFASQIGLGEPWASQRQTPLSHSFCRHVVAGGVPLAVENARQNPLLADNPAIEELGVVAYLGMPLTTAEGHTLGSLCAIESTPRAWSASDVATLEDLAAAATSEIELRLAARRAQTERDFADAVMEVAGALVLVLDPQGRIMRFNRACCQLTGYSAEQMIGTILWERLLPGDWVPVVRASFATAAAARDRGRAIPEEHTGHWICADGSLRLITWRSRMISAQDGRLEFIVSTGIDITERSAAEERFRAAFDGAPHGMVLTSLRPADRGSFVRVNQALCEILGYSQEALEQMSFDSLTEPGRPSSESNSLLAQLAAGEIQSGSFERLYVHAGRHSVWVAVSVSLVRDRHGWPEYAIAQVQDITERKHMERRLEHMAEHDPLTDLLNRRGLQSRLAEVAAAAPGAEPAGAVAVIDLDNFKYVNDTYGHRVGDELLVRCAEAMARCARPADVLARLGGDEFALVMPTSDRPQAMELADQLLECLRELQVEAEGRQVGITGSIGVALIPATPTSSAGELLIAADLAMIEAKEGGRNRAQLADERRGALARAREHQTWVERIREALAADRLELLAQPIAQLGSGAVERQELLLRMRSEDGQLIEPAAFLQVAERFDQIQAIDRWTIARAVELLAAGTLPGALHINLSGVSITDRALIDFAREQISSAGIDGRRLTFELTETAAITRVDRARRLAAGLRELGCTFALDDFGSGFGSFFYLKHLPFDFIKLDGDFILELARSLEDQLTVKAIAGIVRGLGKHSIAEHVPDQQTAQLLLEYGVDYGQGEYFGVPAPVS